MQSKAFNKSKYQHWIDPNEVKPYERNAKIHTPEQIANIVNSINRFGWQQDTVITTDNVLVIGHGRRLAALEIGCEMPYHRIDKAADELTDEDIRELRIADNLTNAETGNDWEILETETADLSFSGFDFDIEENDEPDIKELEDDDGIIEDNTEKPVAVKIVFEDAQKWRANEKAIRDFVDTLKDVSVSVGGYADQ